MGSGRKIKMDIQRCFEILELDREVSIDEAKQAYKDIVTVWHPDRFPNNPRLKQKAEEKLKEANAAYDTVKSFLSSKQEVEPETKKAPQARAKAKTRADKGYRRAEAKTKTEAAVEVGTRIVLSLWANLSETLRCILLGEADDLSGKAQGEPGRLKERQWKSRGNSRGKDRSKDESFGAK